MAKRPAPTAIPDDARMAILHGADRFLLDLHTAKLREALEHTHGQIDTIRFDGADTDAAAVLDECRSFGLMTAHKLVVVDNADQFLKATDTRPGERSAREMMERYATEPSEAATLLLRAETWRPGKLDKAVAAAPPEGAGGAVIKCEPPDPARAVNWVGHRAQGAHDATIEKPAAELLVELIGVDLGRLDTETAKLATAAAGGPITRELVAEMVGQSREDSFWAIQSTLLAPDPGPALKQLQELVVISRHDPVPIMFAYVDLAKKLHAAALAAATGEDTRTTASRLKLWGPARDRVLSIAQRMGPDRARRLFTESVDADLSLKTGRGAPVRVLERLTLRFATAVAS